MLMVAVFALTIGLLVAIPVWQTVLQREKEEELIFRGKQYAEAVRIYTAKKPGRFPSSLEELFKAKCLRKLYRDPMSPSGEWNVILNPGTPGSASGPGSAAQEVLVAPESVVSSIKNAMVIGVVSSSTAKSVKVYYDQESYDKWLFYFGQDPKKLPKISYYGKKD